MSTGSTTVTPSRRVRTAEAVAQAVLARAVRTDRLCAVVADLRDRLDVDHAQISLISDRQIAVVLDGRAASANPPDEDPYAPIVSPLEDTLCVVAMRADEQIGIDDTSLDERVASTPPVVRGYIGSYLGSPIRVGPDSSSGEAMTVGVLCAYNAVAHAWTLEDGFVLERAAIEVARELDIIIDALEIATDVEAR